MVERGSFVIYRNNIKYNIAAVQPRSALNNFDLSTWVIKVHKGSSKKIFLIISIYIYINICIGLVNCVALDVDEMPVGKGRACRTEQELFRAAQDPQT